MARGSSELKSTGYEIFIGMLSILSIFNLLLIYGFVHDSWAAGGASDHECGIERHLLGRLHLPNLDG